MAQGDTAQRDELRSPTGRLLTVVSAAVALGVLALLVSAGSWQQLLGFGTVPLLFTAIIWATFDRPCVRVSDSYIEVRNVFRTVVVPWPAVIDVDLRWGLRLITRLGTCSAWSVPAPARPGYFALRRGQASAPPGSVDTSARRPAEAAQAVVDRWAALRQAGYLDDPRLESDRLAVTWNRQEVVVLSVLALLSIVGIVGYQLG